MTDTIKRDNQLDNFGALTEPMPDDAPRYNFKKIREYCKEHGKTLSELAESEMEQLRSLS